MNKDTGAFSKKAARFFRIVALVFILGTMMVPQAQAFVLKVRGADPALANLQKVYGFRYVVEEDATYHVVPGVQDPNTLSKIFHASYMPVVATGQSGKADKAINGLDPAKHYYVSVLPNSGWTMGGAAVQPGTGEVTVVVNKLPVPTAQITIFAFEDNHPINNAPDLPAERGLEGFRVYIEDAGGKYGATGGQMFYDAFGNPLGTTYDAAGTVIAMGTGEILTGPDGYTVVKNLAPGKYGIRLIPPTGTDWVQTTTIEGTPTNDAWVGANEPPYFREFGTPGVHVFVGFISPTPRPEPVDPADPPGNPINRGDVLSGGITLSGQVVNLHLSRPPDFAFHPGGAEVGSPISHTTIWVGLNEGLGGTGVGLYAAPCDANGNFTINNVPAGRDYQLVIWDDALDVVIGFRGIRVPAASGNIALGQVPVFQWFSKLWNYVFYDTNENGFWDRDATGVDAEPPLSGQAALIRFRDGTVFQTGSTGSSGLAAFDEVFPFFHWLVAEVDFAHLKATGATIVVDAGGDTTAHAAPYTGPAGPGYSGVLAPQAQAIGDPANENGDTLFRTETGPVLTQAFQGFLGQNSIIEWGKTAYGPGPDGLWDTEDDENGGISGIVFYDTTRAEDDPRYNGGEFWQPGIPRVQVNLYADVYNVETGMAVPDGVIDVQGADPLSREPILADVDNWPFQWTGQFDTGHPDYTGAKGPEDVDRNGNGVFDAGDAIQITWSDSWDDSPPTDCPPNPNEFVPEFDNLDCYDGMRNWNQVRPGVFDGGYAFDSYFPGGMASGSEEVAGLPSGWTYIVEAAPPRSPIDGSGTYKIVKEEDKNVDFGETFVPSPLALPPVCINYDGNGGQGHLVPDYLVFNSTGFAPLPGVDPGDLVSPASAGQYTPLCDRKQVLLSAGKNAAAEFFMFTDVPVAGHVVGFVLDDLSNEFDPNSPQFGEKFSPPWVPVAIRDWRGREIGRTYTDEYGKFNALLPSTYTANLAHQSGMGPNMLTTCMNDAGPIPDPGNPGSFITDPQWNRQYSQFCYTFQYMPGTYTYLDTPVVRIAAFAGPDQYPVDCEFSDGTPVINYVTNVAAGGGPYVEATGGTLTITSMGALVPVPNPAYDGPGGLELQEIKRDFGFGATKGSISIGAWNADPDTQITAWDADSITLVVPAGVETGQLQITRGDNGKSTQTGLTIQVGSPNDVLRMPPGKSIQRWVDVAKPGQLLLIPPGDYNESVIMWKPVRLQGWGAGSTRITAIKAPAEKLQLWRGKLQSVIESGLVDLLPGQGIAFGGIEPGTLFTEEAPGVMVLASHTIPNLKYKLWVDGLPRARIDGFTLTGSDWGGGIFVNGYANRLQISNNRVINNEGFYGGGIRIGHPFLTNEPGGTVEYTDASNLNVSIFNNQIAQNGGLNGYGGGLSIHTGTHGYRVTDNLICGNFARGNGGGGIGHSGLSDNGLIADNTIIFNQSFNQGVTVNGGGIYIGGGAPLAGAVLSPGSGSVTVDSNLILGNQAGAGDGGGIYTGRVNGLDVEASPGDVRPWHQVFLSNNTIVNNMAGLAGGGIAMQDTARIKIFNNTVANNDSTATASLAFQQANVSTPQPAGIMSRPHSTPGLSEAIAAAVGGGASGIEYAGFSNPELMNNIVWHNRSSHWVNDPTADPPLTGYSLVPDGYRDLPVTPVLNPRYCILTNTAGYHFTNKTGDPLFVSEYFNRDRGQTVTLPEPTTVLPAPAFDEGGNFIEVRFGPLTLWDFVDGTTLLGDYHITAGSAAIDMGRGGPVNTYISILGLDRDNEVRPNPGTSRVDIGADEFYSAAP